MDGWTVVWIFIIWGYFLPTFIAWKNSHRQMSAIFALNLFLGWSGLAWLACLVWSLLRERETPDE